MKNRTLSIKTRILFLFTLLCAAIATVQTVHAATSTVMNNNDSGAGSLRQAILDANANSGSDTINFGAAVTGTITLTSGQLLITDDLNINGPGADILAVNGNAASRVFHIASGETVTIDGLTIMNGHGGDGGGIYNDHATLTVSNCTIAGNSAVRGGGIHNNGNSGGSATLTVLNSTISGNSTYTYGGGGIFNDGYGSGNATLLVIASTINNNTAVEVGGGIRSEGGYGSATASVRNSTISGNSATGANHCCNAFGGGGIQNDGKNGGSASLEIVNSTFSGNAANLGGGGIYNDGRNGGSATVTLGDTIFEAGSLGENIHNDSATVTSLGYNLSSDDASAFLNQTGDQNSIDPILGPLQDNGGPTFTHALLTGSPAINAGDLNFTPPPFYDQRGPGYPRVANGRIDIGSFEVQTCPQSQGYWRNHPDAWPVNSLTLGSQTYTKAELLTILNTPIGTGKNADASLILADQLIAAKLNIANGADGTPVTSTIADADAVLSLYPGTLPYRVRPNSTNGQQMVNDAATLESYNNGALTAGCGG